MRVNRWILASKRRSLQRQASKARRFRELKDEERDLRRRRASLTAKELDGKVNKRVVYQYLSEGQDTGTEQASKMLETLGLTGRLGNPVSRFVESLDD